MCDAGRILHHLRNNLNLDSTVVLIVSYQTKDSLGRTLLDGQNPVKIMRQTVYVRARIAFIDGFSAHADKCDLLRWIGPISRHSARIILTHGEPHQLQELSYKPKSKYAVNAEIPPIGDKLEV